MIHNKVYLACIGGGSLGPTGAQALLQEKPAAKTFALTSELRWNVVPG